MGTDHTKIALGVRRFITGLFAVLAVLTPSSQALAVDVPNTYTWNKHFGTKACPSPIDPGTISIFNNKIYVADYQNHQVDVFDNGGRIQSIARKAC